MRCFATVVCANIANTVAVTVNLHLCFLAHLSMFLGQSLVPAQFSLVVCPLVCSFQSLSNPTDCALCLGHHFLGFAFQIVALPLWQVVSQLIALSFFVILVGFFRQKKTAVNTVRCQEQVALWAAEFCCVRSQGTVKWHCHHCHWLHCSQCLVSMAPVVGCIAQPFLLFQAQLLCSFLTFSDECLKCLCHPQFLGLFLLSFVLFCFPVFSKDGFPFFWVTFAWFVGAADPFVFSSGLG